MKNTQLFDLLGEIDNKFLDETIDCGSEKPIKVDTSRSSVRWYHIAAPIAACIVLGAGVFVGLRYRNFPAENPFDSTNSGSAGIGSNLPNSGSVIIGPASPVEADIEVCKQMILDKYPDVSGFSTRIMDINFDGVDETVVLPDGGDSCIHVFSKQNGEMTETGIIDIAQYENCLKDLSKLEIDGEAGSLYWSFHFRYEDKENDMFIDAIPRIAYNGASYDIDFPLAAYTVGYNGSDIDNLTLKKDWKYSPSSEGSGIETGTEISRDEFVSIWTTHMPYEEFDPRFAQYLRDVNGDANDPFRNDVDDFFPPLDLDNIPLMDSASFDPDTSSVIKRARIVDVLALPNANVHVSLVGENIFRLAEDGDEYIRMDKMSVIYFYKSKLYALVDIDPISANNTDGSHGNIIVRKENPAFDIYHLDNADIIVVGDNDYIRSDGANCNIVALTNLDTHGTVFQTSDPELILLKGIYENNDSIVSRVNMSNILTVSGNSLLDAQNGVEFRFFPEMFEQYDDPDAEHAHFKCLDYEAPAQTVKGGTAYNTMDNPTEYAKVPRMEGVHENDDGTQEDLDRWNNFISSVDPAVIHTAGWLDAPTHSLSDKDANMLLNILKTAKLTPANHKNEPAPAGGGSSIIGCDSDGNVLFEAYWNDHWISVTFDDSGKSYYFDVSDSTKESLNNLPADIF